MDTAQSKNRLLLVDGDPKSLRVLDVSLKKAGFEVTTATSGREALAMLEASQPDLIISDTDLDEMDGFELCSQIKARPPWAKIPFLFVSGRKSIEDKIRGLELGVDDYLTKPIYIKEIGIRVRTALQRAERERMESRREGRTRFAGDLSDVGVVDLVQTIELNRKSGIIHIVNRDTRRGSVFFRDGKVIDAEVGRLSGANAMYRLFSWSEGQFAVEFKQIRRHDVIDTPMAPLLMEGMRRLDESARLLDSLPSTSSVLEVDCRALAEELAELPDEVNSVLRLCDGTRTLQEVVEDSDHPDLEALTFINKLFTGQIIFAREAPERGGESEPSERLAHWLSEGGAEDGAAADDVSASSEFAAAQLLAPDGEVIPERTPAPTAPLAAASDSDPARVPAALAFEGELLPAAEVVGTTSEDLLPKTPGPGSDAAEKVSKAISSGTPVTEQEAVLSAEESLGAVLPLKPDATSQGSNEFATPPDTLKGLPVDNLFADNEAKVASPTVLPGNPEPPPVQSMMETRSTKPLGLAERLLSEDSAVRASAMHEAINDDGGRVAGPQSNERNTREYGNPVAEAAAALVQEVVSSAHDSKRESPSPAHPERPTKEVDWGAWPTDHSPVVREEPAVAILQPSSDPSSVDSKTATPPDSQPATVEPALPAAPKAAPVEGSPRQQEAASPTATPQGAPEEQPSSRHQVPLVSSSESKAPSPPIPPSSSSNENRADESVSKPPVPKPKPQVRAGRSARKSLQASQIWIMVGGAFALGVVGYLVFSNNAAPPSAVRQHAANTPVAPPQAIPAPLVPELVPEKEKAEGKSAPLPASKSDKVAKVAAPLGLGAPPPATAELRRKCLEVDAQGQGKAKAVSTACRPALEADPKDAEVMVVLARAEIDRGHLGEARTLARKALAADPRRMDAYVFLGTAEQEAGRIDEARAAYKKYLELAPDGHFARELRAILNNL